MLHVLGARSVRRAADAEALAAELGDFFSPLVFDVTDPKAVAAAAAEVRARTKGRTLLGLVNNAGKFPRPMRPEHNGPCAVRPCSFLESQTVLLLGRMHALCVHDCDKKGYLMSRFGTLTGQ